MVWLRPFLLLIAFQTAIANVPFAEAGWPFKAKPAKSETLESVLPRENCLDLLIKNFYLRMGWFKKASRAVDRAPDFYDDLEYLREWRHKKNYGAVTSEYDDALQTRVYYSPTAAAGAEGRVARTDPEAAGLVVYLHGSGTMKANGSTFNHKVSRMNAAGFSTLSFDLPFHRDGPQNAEFTKSSKFLAWVLDVVERHRVPGQPVVIAGHSGGATIVGELVARYPESFDGAVMLSPAGFNKDLKRWYQNHTLEFLKSQEEVKPNSMGARWAYIVERQFQWMKPGKKTAVASSAKRPKLRVLSGEYEEFVPGPLDEKGLPKKEPRTYDLCKAIRAVFPFADCRIEPGIGHRLNNHVDRDGKDVVIREILGAFGESVVAKAKTKASARRQSRVDELAQNAVSDPFFAEWLGRNKAPGELAGIFERKDEKLAAAILKEFASAVQLRERLLWETIRSTERHSPEFFARHRALIEEVGKSPNKKDQLYSAYLDHVETLTADHPLRGRVDGDEWRKRIAESTAARKKDDNPFASPDVQKIFAARKDRKAGEGELKKILQQSGDALRSLAERDARDPALAGDFDAAIENLGAYAEKAEYYASSTRVEAATIARILGEGTDPAKQAVVLRDAAERTEARLQNLVKTFRKLRSLVGEGDREAIALVRRAIAEDPALDERKSVLAWIDRL